MRSANTDRGRGPSAGSVVAAVTLLAVVVLVWPSGTAVAAPPATSLRLTAAPESVVHGATTTLTATLSRHGTTERLAGQPVRFEARPLGAREWARIGSGTTRSNGRASATTTPRRHMEYRAVFEGSSRWAASRSSRRTVRVAVSVSSKLESSSVWLGRATWMSGAVRPAHPGDEVLLQRYSSDGWQVLARQRLDTASAYRFRVSPASGGTHRYRVVKRADDDHDRGVSRRRELLVRPYAFPIRPASAASYPRAHHDYPATDIFAPCGTAVVSPTAGVVQEVSRRDEWDPAVNAGATRGGLSVSLVGTDGVRYYGSHFERIEPGIAPGTRVAARQPLGTVGRTGSARHTPCHLHFGISPPCGVGDWEVRRGVVWPWSYLDAWRAGTPRSPRAAVDAWAAANPRRCPAR
jgi:murein DD-endopeptidase MepM/ murein hydrolase activator NlpD